MPCLLSKDQPLRVQLSKGGVIHAGDYHTYGGHGRGVRDPRTGEVKWEKIPKHKAIRVACTWREIPLSKKVGNKNKITCKNCMKTMGMIEGAVFPDRFVIRNKKTGEFLKNTNSRCSAWSEHLSDAFFWKRKGDAEGRCKVGRWVDDEGKIHKTQRYEMGNNGMMNRGVYKYKKFRNPDLEIKKVKITLTD